MHDVKRHLLKNSVSCSDVNLTCESYHFLCIRRFLQLTCVSYWIYMYIVYCLPDVVLFDIISACDFGLKT